MCTEISMEYGHKKCAQKKNWWLILRRDSAIGIIIYRILCNGTTCGHYIFLWKNLKGNYIGYYKVSFIQIPLNLFIKECTYYNKKSISVLKIDTAENSSPWEWMFFVCVLWFEAKQIFRIWEELWFISMLSDKKFFFSKRAFNMHSWKSC